MALMDVVQWHNKKDEVVYRFPEGGIRLGAQLIVMEHQEAVFFREGRALDSFGAGRYTLQTGNIPILEKLVKIPFGGKSPLPAEVYFVNKTEVPNLKWGTKQPIQFLDPVYNITVPIRAFGAYSIRITETKPFLMTAIGSWQAFDTNTIGSAMRDQIIMPKLSDLIAEFMQKNNVTVLKLAAFLDEIGSAGKAKCAEDFTSYGIELVRFAVESINIPDEDESVKRLKKILADKAEITIMGEDYKTKRTFDTMEKAAGSNGMSGAMMGAGMGVGMGGAMADMAKGVMGGTGKGQALCQFCNTANPAGAKFCSSCGKEIASETACPSCKAKISAGSKFCPACGANIQEKACVKCGKKIPGGTKFCPDCGATQS